MARWILKILCLGLFLASLQSAQACIWSSVGAQSYWPDRRISVCFMEVESDRQRRARDLIRNAYAEFNQRTPYTLFGFDNCEVPSSGQAQIRINLAQQGHVGQAFRDRMITDSYNLTLPVGDARPGVPQSDDYVQGQALHELLHMFGVEHDEPRDGKDFEPGRALSVRPHYVLGDYDPLSVMVRSSGDRIDQSFEPGRILSDGDVACMNIIATGDFPGHPSTITAAEAYQPRTPQAPALLEPEDPSSIDQ